uniref:Uncharacterized protein n=1 Tax=Vitis vinifera TaxID=29760 RepID=A5B1H0_VITVI|nr:hypothetical protein VITISV_000122 [Vitis vinifera]
MSHGSVLLAMRDIAHPTRRRILSGRRPTFSGCLTSGIFVRPTFHLLWIFHIWRLTPNGRRGRFNFLGQTCPDPLIALTRRASAADNSNSPDSLARQTLAIHRIHFRPQ